MRLDNDTELVVALPTANEDAVARRVESLPKDVGELKALVHLNGWCLGAVDCDAYDVIFAARRKEPQFRSVSLEEVARLAERTRARLLRT